MSFNHAVAFDETRIKDIRECLESIANTLLMPDVQELPHAVGTLMRAKSIMESFLDICAYKDTSSAQGFRLRQIIYWNSITNWFPIAPGCWLAACLSWLALGWLLGATCFVLRLL